MCVRVYVLMCLCLIVPPLLYGYLAVCVGGIRVCIVIVVNLKIGYDCAHTGNTLRMTPVSSLCADIPIEWRPDGGACAHTARAVPCGGVGAAAAADAQHRNRRAAHSGHRVSHDAPEDRPV